jgi:hypothetical protein
VRREWSPDQLAECWTLLEDDRRLLRNKSGASRLGFSLILKFFELDGRFPRHSGEVPPAAIEYVAAQVGVEPTLFAKYTFAGRTIEHHRAEIRRELGFRECSVADEDSVAAWMAAEVCPVELTDDRLRQALTARCRALRIEPPGPSRVERVLGPARAAFEQQFTTQVAGRLPAATVARLEELVANYRGRRRADAAAVVRTARGMLRARTATIQPAESRGRGRTCRCRCARPPGRRRHDPGGAHAGSALLSRPRSFVPGHGTRS